MEAIAIVVATLAGLAAILFGTDLLDRRLKARAVRPGDSDRKGSGSVPS